MRLLLDRGANSDSKDKVGTLEGPSVVLCCMYGGNWGEI